MVLVFLISISKLFQNLLLDIWLFELHYINPAISDKIKSYTVFPGVNKNGERLLSILACQSSDLERAIANYILLFYGQGALLDLGNAFDIVHCTNDANRHFNILFGN